MDLLEEKTPLISHSSSNIIEFQDSVADTTPDEYDIAIQEKYGHTRTKAYWWRWIVLVTFVANVSINIAIWIGFSPIAEIVKCYYGISDFWVNSVSMVYMLTYTLFIYPSVWVLERGGLRTTAVIAACCNAAGACLKVAGVGKYVHVM